MNEYSVKINVKYNNNHVNYFYMSNKSGKFFKLCNLHNSIFIEDFNITNNKHFTKYSKSEYINIINMKEALE